MKKITLTLLLIIYWAISYGQLYRDFFIGWKSSEVKSYLQCKRIDYKYIDIPDGREKPHIIRWRDNESQCIITTFFDNADHVKSMNIIPSSDEVQQAIIKYLNTTCLRTFPRNTPESSDDYWIHTFNLAVYRVTMDIVERTCYFNVQKGKAK